MRRAFVIGFVSLFLAFAFAGICAAKPDFTVKMFSDRPTETEHSDYWTQIQTDIQAQTVDNSIATAAESEGEVLLEEHFDTPPSDWSGVAGAEGYGWKWGSGQGDFDNFSLNTPLMYYRKDNPSDPTVDPLTSPAVDASNYEKVVVDFAADFWFSSSYTSNADFFVVEISRDGGGSWEAIAQSRGSFSGPKLVETQGSTEFMVRFRYDDSGGASYAVELEVNEVSITGLSELPSENDAVIYQISGPFFILAGIDTEVEANMTSSKSQVHVCTEYGTFDGENVNDVQTSEMCRDADDSDNWSGSIPGDAGSPGDLIVWRVHAEDAGGNIVTKPDGSSTPDDISDDWYQLPVYSGEVNWDESEVRGGDWWTFGEPWAFSPNVIPNPEIFSPPEDDVREDGYPMICTEPDGAYPDNSDGYLTLNFDITPGASSIFAWSYLIDCPWGFSYAQDGYNVEINDGSGWVVVNPIIAYDMEIMALDYDDGIVGVASSSNAIDLSTWEGTPVNLRFHFASYSNVDGYTGVYLHQFMIAGADIPGWGIGGTVSDASANPVVGATVQVRDASTDPLNSSPIMCVETDENGEYTCFPLSPSDYLVQASADGCVPATSSATTVTDVSDASVPFSMDPIDEYVTLDGSISSELAGQPAHALIQGTDFETETGTDGSFTLEMIPPGFYDLECSTVPPGSQGYHTTVFPGQAVYPGMPTDNSYALLVIDPPYTPTLVPGSRSIQTVMPLSETLEVSPLRIERLKEAIASGEKDETLSKTNLASMRGLLQYFLTLEAVEEIPPKTPDPLGYRVRLDGFRILPDLFHGRSFTIYGLQNGKEYSVEVAVDYGYGDEYLVWSPAATATPDQMVTTVESIPFEWVETRPALGGSGGYYYSSNYGYTSISNFGGTFNFYGEDYTSLLVYTDGVISFDESAQINYFSPSLGDEDAPNALIAPYWVDLVNYDSDDGIYSWYDDTNNRQIIQYVLSHNSWTADPPSNIANFEVILDFDDNSITFQYLSTETGWSEDALIGIEDNDGNLVMSWPSTNLGNSVAVKVTNAYAEYGTVSGHVQDLDENPIADALVQVDGRRIETKTDANGDFILYLLPGDYNARVNMPGYAEEMYESLSVTANTNIDAGSVSLGSVSGIVSETSIELTVPVDEAGVYSETVTVNNTGEMTMSPVAWWLFKPEWVAEYEAYSPVSTTPDPQIEWVGDNISQRRRPQMVGPVHKQAVATTTAYNSLLSFNASTALSPTVYDMWGVGVTDQGIHLADWGGTISLYTFDNTGAYVSQVEFPDNLQMINDFSLDLATNTMISVASDGSVWRFNSDMSILERIGDVGFEAIGCAYNWMTNQLYAYTWGDYFGNEPERFVVCDLYSGEITDLAVPSGIGMVTGLAFVPCDADGLFIYALCSEDNMGTIHRYNHRFNFWEGSGKPIFDFVSSNDNTGGFFATPLLGPETMSPFVGDFAAAEHMNFVTIRNDYDSYTHVDVWEGPQVPMWFQLNMTDMDVPSQSSTDLTISVDLSQDPTFVPEAGTDAYAEVFINAPYWDNPPVIDVVIHFTGDEGVVETSLPDRYAFYPPAPNPFNPVTDLRFDLVEPQVVTLTVYNVLGQEVARLIDGERVAAGSHRRQFNASNLASGMYIVCFDSPALKVVRKVVLVK